LWYEAGDLIVINKLKKLAFLRRNCFTGNKNLSCHCLYFNQKKQVRLKICKYLKFQKDLTKWLPARLSQCWRRSWFLFIWLIAS